MASSSSNVSRNGRVSFSGGTASLLLERSRISTGNRRPTPDSEALVSSDEEHGQSQSGSQSLAYRRGSTSRPQTSWLSDIGHPQPARKFSFGGLSLGSSGSQPPTPSSETTPRLQPSLQGSGPSPAGFQPSIWNPDRKQPPKRLAEVSQSPTSINAAGLDQSLHSPGDRSAQGIGVEIPLDPVFKPGQRAMSFSVGQADQLNRLRAGVTRKNSAGGLGLGHGGLAQLREDEDDLNSVDTDSDAGVKLPPSEAGSDSQGLLKQAIRQRTAPTSAGMASARGPPPGRSMSFRSPEYAVEEEDNNQGKPKTTWNTALGFGLAPSGLESRRHSLADVPLRARAVSFAPTRLREEPATMMSASGHAAQSPSVQTPPANDMSLSQEADFNYFGGQAVSLRNADRHHQGGFSVPGRHILYWVQFKCERGGVYYVVDGSGLSPKKGEMVLVEGDRGSDLGTVHAVDINSTQVKELRQEFQYRHFRWLIDFSRTAQTNPQVRWALSESVDARTAAARHPSNFHHGEDAKPKLIKRMAHMHEIQGLVHKEGAEAKAKRVCQQKVVEHGLQMEILDAEYQWDQRKLTFYYFAETYVNFNDLVTDLFKIFKTRIWMSAVNPASFASAAPPGALGMPAPPSQPSFSPASIGTMPLMQAPVTGNPLAQAPGIGGAGFPRETYPGFDPVGGWGGFSGIAGYNQPSQPPFPYEAQAAPSIGNYNPPTTNTSPLANPAFASQWPVPPVNALQTAQDGDSPVSWVRPKPNATIPQYSQYTGAPVRNPVSAWTPMNYPSANPSEIPAAAPSAAAPPQAFAPPRNGHTTPQNEAQAAWYAAFANMNVRAD